MAPNRYRVNTTDKDYSTNDDVIYDDDNCLSDHNTDSDAYESKHRIQTLGKNKL